MFNRNNQPRKNEGWTSSPECKVIENAVAPDTTSKKQARQPAVKADEIEDRGPDYSTSPSNLVEVSKIFVVSAAGALATLAATSAFLGEKALTLPLGSILPGALYPLLLPSKLPIPFRCALGAGLGLFSHYGWAWIFRNVM